MPASNSINQWTCDFVILPSNTWRIKNCVIIIIMAASAFHTLVFVNTAKNVAFLWVFALIHRWVHFVWVWDRSPRPSRNRRHIFLDVQRSLLLTRPSCFRDRHQIIDRRNLRAAPHLGLHSMSQSQKVPKETGTCGVCWATFRIQRATGRLHKHGHRDNPCLGSDKPPAASATTPTGQVLPNVSQR